MQKSKQKEIVLKIPYSKKRSKLFFLIKFRKYIEMVTKLNTEISRAKKDMSEYVSVNEWMIICGNDTLKNRCIHELELIRKSRNKEFEAKSENFLNRESFMMDDTLLGSLEYDKEIYEEKIRKGNMQVKSSKQIPDNQKDFSKKYESNRIENNTATSRGYNQKITDINTKKNYETVKDIKEESRPKTERNIKHYTYEENIKNPYDNLQNTCLPSYPSLKDCGGDELLYFKQKCTALIFRNEELRTELQSSKSSFELMKSQLFEKRGEFDTMLKGFNDNIETNINRQSNYLSVNSVGDTNMMFQTIKSQQEIVVDKIKGSRSSEKKEANAPKTERRKADANKKKQEVNYNSTKTTEKKKETNFIANFFTARKKA